MNIQLKTVLDARWLRAWRRWPWWLRALLGGVLLLTLWAVVGHLRHGPDAEDVPVGVVQSGPLAINITEVGTIQSRDKVVVRNEVEGRNTIISLIEEGKTVRKDDLLVELDASDFQKRQAEQQILVENAESAVIQARENLALVLNQNQAALDQTAVDAQFAGLELVKYEQGELPQEIQKLEAQITLAREEMQRVGDKLEWSRKLAKDGYVTRMELQADELAVKKCELDLQLALRALTVLKEYASVQKMTKLRSDINQTGLAVERAKRKAVADQTRAETDLRARKQEYERQKTKLDHIVDQIAKCRILAPTDGLVVYASTAGPRRGQMEPLRAGLDVYERQDLIYIPTAASMIAEVKIQEASLTKLRAGLPVRLKVDVLPNRIFWGQLEKIGVMPDAVDAWLNPDLKLYTCTVTFDAASGELRPGMGCQAEIIIEEYDQAVFVPVQSVLRIKGRPTVFVMTPGGPRERPVEVGLDNNRMIRILSGLKPGEKVLLNPPLPLASVEDEGSAKEARSRAQPPAKAKTAPPGKAGDA